MIRLTVLTHFINQTAKSFYRNNTIHTSQRSKGRLKNVLLFIFNNDEYWVVNEIKRNLIKSIHIVLVKNTRVLRFSRTKIAKINEHIRISATSLHFQGFWKIKVTDKIYIYMLIGMAEVNENIFMYICIYII